MASPSRTSFSSILAPNSCVPVAANAASVPSAASRSVALTLGPRPFCTTTSWIVIVPSGAVVVTIEPDGRVVAPTTARLTVTGPAAVGAGVGVGIGVGVGVDVGVGPLGVGALGAGAL